MASPLSNSDPPSTWLCSVERSQAFRGTKVPLPGLRPAASPSPRGKPGGEFGHRSGAGLCGRGRLMAPEQPAHGVSLPSCAHGAASPGQLGSSSTSALFASSLALPSIGLIAFSVSFFLFYCCFQFLLNWKLQIEFLCIQYLLSVFKNAYLTTLKRDRTNRISTPPHPRSWVWGLCVQIPVKHLPLLLLLFRILVALLFKIKISNTTADVESNSRKCFMGVSTIVSSVAWCPFAF